MGVKGEVVRFSRRRFLKTTSMAGALWTSRFQSVPLWAVPKSVPSPCLLHSGSGYAPFIDAFLKQIRPGSDEFIAEKYAADLEEPLGRWRDSLIAASGDLHAVRAALAEDLEAVRLGTTRIESLRKRPPVESEKVSFPAPEHLQREAFIESLAHYLAHFKKIDVVDMQVDFIEILDKDPVRVRTEIHYDLIGSLGGNQREERTGEWTLVWRKDASDKWTVLSWTAGSELRSRLTGQGFVDISTAVLGENASYRDQMLHGIDHWRTVLDGASGIDIYGNNGICVGDFDGDGLDDIYVCQPAGLPNRLYKNKGDGTFADVTESAGVGVLDGTSCAIFADLTNSGRQDLIVVRTTGPLLFVNQGNGKFELRPDAFHFAKPPQGTFTGASVADYDRDGLLDVYFCTYSFYQGLSEYEFPKPYYDAQNGPPNFLLKNRGGYVFEDVTSTAGLNVSNNRFSFDALWSDYNHDGWPDLYVVNDFGRKVLYRNNGNGTFTDVSAEAGIEDPGEGMSMTWFDYDNDGFEDMYVVNMWESAGRRVTAQPEFMPSQPESVRHVYWLDGMGNSLLHNEGASGKFRDVTQDSGTRFGGWNWGSDAWDFDHDGYPDLYIVNGFISGRRKEDLSSFYWRQIAAHSLDGGGRSKNYADAWSAINEFIRSDYTWSGYQRNNLYLNNRNSTFTESAGLLGIDCIQDSRSFALIDLDGDGRLEIVLKNRTAPQVRIFHNQLQPIGPSLIFSLKGTKSNRDAIGAVVEIETAHGKQRRTLRAGSGFLSQNTKLLHFGLGDDPKTVRATVEWPNGTKQVLENIPLNHRIEVLEGAKDFRAIPFNPLREHVPVPGAVTDEGVERHASWLLDPIFPPNLDLPDRAGVKHSLADAKGQLQLVVFAGAGCDDSQKYLLDLDRGRAILKKAGVALLAVQTPAQGAQEQTAPSASFPVLLADEKTSTVYSLFYRYLFDRRRDIALPTSFLLDQQGAVVRVYSGAPPTIQIAADAERVPKSVEERMHKALPFEGQFYRGEFHHNYFTYGVAFLQYGFLDDALTAFEQSITRNPNYAGAHYNVGLIYLNKGQFEKARTSLQKAIELDPSNADAWNNLGVVLGQMEDYAGAQRNFQHVLDMQPAHLLAVQNMVKLLRFRGRMDDARALLLKAIAADPGQAEFHQGLAMLYVEQNNLGSAEAEFRKAVDLDPQNPEMLNGLGVVLMQEGNSDQAMELFKRCTQIAPTNDRPYLNMAVLYLTAGQTDKAHEVLSEFLARDPENKDIRQALEEVDKAK